MTSKTKIRSKTIFSSVFFKLNYFLLTLKPKASTDSAHSYPCSLESAQGPIMKAHLPKPTGKNVHAWGGQEKAEEKKFR